MGFEKTEITIGAQSVIDVTLKPDVQQLGEVVVTALGIERDQKSLGYSVQEVSGEQLSEAKEQNVINSLSGKVAGVQVRSSNTMGGSANILIRGTNTLAGNNQPLFVVDGVPIDNSSYNSADQERGGGGYDYGNPAADLNPEDIKSMSVLKGGSAAALYGSRALYGVILITTKKGAKNQGVGVSVNSSVTFSQVNKNTLPQHQKEYGAGYGAYWTYADLDGDGVDEQIVNTADDASWGAKFDPNLEVVHWDALFLGEDNYGETRPWVAGEAGIEEFFETGVSLRNNISVSGGTEKATYRLSYTNEDTKGIVPNSSMKSNKVALNASLEMTEKLKISTSVNYVGNDVIGRYGTGYSGTNVMQSFGQWFQTNLDFNRLKNYKDEAGNQRAWNLAGPSDPRGYYFNNPYWVVNENYQSDGRDRVFGNVFLEYELADGIKLNGRSTLDFYNFGQQERVNVGSAITDVPSYVRREYTFMERNDDFFVTVDKYLNDNFSISGLVGVNHRNTTNASLQMGTFRGMVNKDVFAISNTVSPEVEYTDDFSEKAQRSVYGNLSFGFNDMLFLDLTARNDWSSTLPEGANSYFYPSV
ncbi:TonB-dependent receptor plug domain-containing protein [Marivirga arenosa]|uniref:TonB-dependent receptor plug domain-containing protein n=1 Tax=Marivirga arenosa TaxID=3059076 RepID=A0AA49GDD5_9BACT|nr:TonB-dependent receptor plug domain-containing protein [Marivirga sp. BKB1-2]WKK83262.2 TonB-dependent receptor plug domain-containing protein [Marivirga sp. BKB1-2]